MPDSKSISLTGPLLKVENLKVYFPILGGVFRHKIGEIKAVDDVSFEVRRGQTVGLVGESGSGKTTVGRAIIRLTEPTAGAITYDGQVISTLGAAAFRPYRKKIQIIFQDPYNSLNPRLSVFEIIGEALEIHFPEIKLAGRRERVAELLDQVGLKRDHLDRYPHEFSGGQRQRIGIARALAVNPEFLVCDEPVSALDVSVQAQIVNLLQDLQEQLGLTYLFIAHDLAVVEHISDFVLVMNGGKIVEAASAEAIYENPQHDYTRKLLSAVPKL
jgi:peptide/nickel transport system ATP-binding protein/oligopeptide transport system ATP-binding protein